MPSILKNVGKHEQFNYGMIIKQEAFIQSNTLRRSVYNIIIYINIYIYACIYMYICYVMWVGFYIAHA